MRMSTLALVAAGLVALAGCGDNDAAVAAAPTETAPAPTPSPTPSPSPTPTPEPLPPVRGERAGSQVDVTDKILLGPDDRGDAIDRDAVSAFETTVYDWLDAHLDDLQRGGEGALAVVDGAGLTTRLDDASRAALTTALASPEAPVASARYEMTAYFDHTIEYAVVAVSVTAPDGSVRSADLLFTPSADGAPQLVLAQTGEVSS